MAISTLPPHRSGFLTSEEKVVDKEQELVYRRVVILRDIRGPDYA
jgi:hypothetical protein